MKDELFDWPEFNIVGRQENETEIVVRVEKICAPSHCPHCGTLSRLYKHGHRFQWVLDLPVRSKRVGLEVKRRRYQCRECSSTFWERLESVDDKRKMTKRLVQTIERHSLSNPFVEVAARVGVNEKTIRNIFNDYAARKERDNPLETPKWLGIDEIRMMRKPRLVLTHVENRTVYDLEPNCNQKTIIKRLSEIADKHHIEYVTINMRLSCKESVQAVLPKAFITVDKLHAVQMANQAIDSVRRSLEADLTSPEWRQLHREGHILLKRKHDLHERELTLLKTWLENIPALKETYELKEELHCIWDVSGATECRQRYKWWRQRCIASPVQHLFIDLVTAADHWQDELFNCFNARSANAYSESINTIIQQAARTGRGYSFEVARAKILFNDNLTGSQILE